MYAMCLLLFILILYFWEEKCPIHFDNTYVYSFPFSLEKEIREKVYRLVIICLQSQHFDPCTLDQPTEGLQEHTFPKFMSGHIDLVQ